MSGDEPTRFREPGSAASEELSALFREGTADFPTDAELAALSAKLGPVLDGAAAGTGAATAGSGLTSGAKLGLLALGAAGAGVLVWGLGSPRERPAPAVSPAPAVQVHAPVSAPPVPVIPPSGASNGEKPPATASEPSAPPAAKSGRPALAPPSRPVETEAEFLERARGALGSNPALALTLANQHRARFATGVLAEEREVIAIEALKRLGRSAEAERRVEAFVRRYPGSAYRKKLEAGSGR